MSRVRIYQNPLDSSDSVLHIRTDNVLNVFKEVKMKCPQARIFLRPACLQNDVTPTNHVDAAALQILAKNQEFDIVCHAGDPMTIVAVASAVLSVGMAVWTYLNMPETPEGINGSANNELSKRSNRERYKGRVPDIFGKVKSIPDLIAAPVLYYRADGIEIEECLMCVGRGEYEISDIKDGDTFGATIDGFASSVYAPGQSLTGIPQVQIGTAFTEAPLVGKKSSAVTGQTLEPWSAPVFDTAVEGTMYPQYPNRLYLVGGGLDAKFTVGEQVIIDAEPLLSKDAVLSGNANIEMTGVLTVASSADIADAENFKTIQINTLLVSDAENGIVDLAGQYAVLSVVKSGTYIYEVTLSEYASVNPNWLQLTEDNNAAISSLLADNAESINISGFYNAVTAVTSNYIELEIAPAVQAEWKKLEDKNISEAVIELSKPTDNWLGWFYIDYDDIDKLIFNFYYPKGMYSVGSNGKNYQYNAVFAVDYQELDSNGAPTGQIFESHYQEWELRTYGFGMSKIFDLPARFLNGVRVRVRKGGDVWVASKTTRVNDLKLKSVYACSKLDKLVYDKVTLVRSLTVATDGALSVKERQWNCIATRKVYTYKTGGQSLYKVASSNFADIVCAMHTDEMIGRRSLETLDVVGLYAVSGQISQYFGTDKATEFNYTFDKWNTSYEESLALVAGCVGANARRDSGKFHVQFECENISSAILFNHRNKQPGSETRSERFGMERDYDGVEVTWIDPDNSWSESVIKLPDDQISNPKKVELKGVTNRLQAHFITHRAWNKIRFQRETVQFSAYGEAELVTVADRIAVTDDTQPMLVSSGDVVAWSGQNITVSQPAVLEQGEQYVIHLQLSNRRVETMRVTQGNSEFELVLERLPFMPLVVGFECAKYSITLEQEKDSEAFLISEISGSGQSEAQITAINYDNRYYRNDNDYLKNVIDEQGNEIALFDVTYDFTDKRVISLDDNFQFSRSSAATYFNSEGILSDAGIDVPRFDHEYVDGKWLRKGLLIEESSTNTILNSASASGTPYSGSSVVKAHGVEIPEFGVGEGVQYDCTGGMHTIKLIIAPSGSIAANQFAYFSAIIKNVGVEQARLGAQTDSSASAQFLPFQARQYGFFDNYGASHAGQIIFYASAVNRNISAIIAYPQREVGKTYRSSFIKTGTLAVTRAVDDLKWSRNNGEFTGVVFRKYIRQDTGELIVDHSVYKKSNVQIRHISAGVWLQKLRLINRLLSDEEINEIKTRI
jgi:hypothetical protein